MINTERFIKEAKRIVKESEIAERDDPLYYSHLSLLTQAKIDEILK